MVTKCYQINANPWLSWQNVRFCLHWAMFACIVSYITQHSLTGGSKYERQPMPSTANKKKIALCWIILAASVKKWKQIRSQMRVWCKKWLSRRGELGSHMKVLFQPHFMSVLISYSIQFLIYIPCSNESIGLLHFLCYCCQSHCTFIYVLMKSLLAFHKQGYSQYMSINSVVSYLDQWMFLGSLEIVEGWLDMIMIHITEMWRK